MMLSDWCGMRPLESMMFQASVILRSPVRAPMRSGLTVFYYDDRCAHRPFNPYVDLPVPFVESAATERRRFVSRIRQAARVAT
jgi:hypothetical protein